MLRHEGQQGTQVVEIEQQQATVVGELERDLQDARLRVVQLEHASEQGRSDLAHRGSQRMAASAVHVPKGDRIGLGPVIGHADRGDACGYTFGDGARHREACNVAFHIGNEDRNAETREAFRDDHQRDGLAGAGGACGEAVTIAVLGEQIDVAFALA